MLVASHDQSLSYTQQDLDFQNDYSNPQQGTSSRRFDPGSPSSRTMNQSVSTTQQYVKNHHDRRSTMQNIIPSTVKDDRKLFVGGLPLDITYEEFHSYFLQFGSIMDSVVMFDRETRKPRGFGFVTFHDPEVTTQLLAMAAMNSEKIQEDGESDSGRLEMRGKMIEIKRAQPKDASISSSKQQSSYISQSSSNYSITHHYPLNTQYQEQYIPPNAPYSNDEQNIYPVEYVPPEEAPPTPAYIHYAAAPSMPSPMSFHCAAAPPLTPVISFTPQTPFTPQAAFELAHHMLFYSQLLQTPSLMATPNPMMMGFELQQYQVESANSTKRYQCGKPFHIGGAGFYPESDLAEDDEECEVG